MGPRHGEPFVVNSGGIAEVGGVEVVGAEGLRFWGMILLGGVVCGRWGAAPAQAEAENTRTKAAVAK